ncbi:hypothetical protein [Adhaeribacter pallidiroseus]|uniref:Transporter n=1 Tax=Adhaeribacter pallidiroseus TaxID=2072847 RepID=A0A369QBS0_9BACT|nr:hypothetical protein [Adhaeribacter pallidiroseus]RDC61892.1 hypothetical protein AHMF7616_00481 [Adhaeribacter pallidiroseus]
MKTNFYPLYLKITFLLLVFTSLVAKAQTEQDALMMGERKLCVAGSVGYNSWTNYWEGTFKRDNANLGEVSTKSAMLMLNYGLKNNLNIMASLPYIKVKATQGTLYGLGGFQDVGVFVKYKAWQQQLGQQNISLFAVGGYSTPSNKYNVDFLPMCIGLGSRVLSGRLIADVQVSKLFFTLSGAYLHRSNVEIDRSAYYTDHQINSHEVEMPDAGNFQFRTGYRTPRLIAEAFVDNMTTFGGFDIRKNDMPFVSNQMNSTKVGVEAKHYLAKIPALGFHANAWHTVAGRNVGQATGFMAGVDYIFNLSPKSAK